MNVNMLKHLDSDTAFSKDQNTSIPTQKKRKKLLWTMDIFELTRTEKAENCDVLVEIGVGKEQAGMDRIDST